MENVSLNLPIVFTFITYAMLMLGIGFYFFSNNNTTQDYFLGNRTMGPAVSALSAGASDMSGWLLLGLPGALYVSGLVEAYIAIGLSIGATLNWIFVAKRLRVYTSVISDSITIPDYFETRFSDDLHILRVLCAVVILIFFTFYISSGLVGGAKLFEATFGLDYSYALTIGTLIIVVYTFFGGYKAVCWTDLIQGLLMLCALIVVFIVMLNNIGGFSEAYKYIAKSDEGKNKLVQVQNEIPYMLIDNQYMKENLSNVIETLSSTKDTKIKLHINLSAAQIAEELKILKGGDNKNNKEKINILLNEINNSKDKNLDPVKSLIVSTYDDDMLMDLQLPNIINGLKSIGNVVVDIEQNITSTSQIAKELERLKNNDDGVSIDRIHNILSSIQKSDISVTSRMHIFDNISILGIISALAWGLGYFGQPHILVRFMSIRSTKDIPIATTIGMSWMIVSLFSACMIGLLGVAYVNKFDININDPEKIFIVMSQTLFNPWVAGILLSAILAAIMSTASSQLLVSSSTIAEDFYRRVFKMDASEKNVMFVSRISVVVVSLIAFFISTDKDSSVLSIVSYAWAGFGASFGSVILFSLFWSRMTRMGAIAGMLTGAVVVVVYKNFLAKILDFPIYEIVPGFICASLAIVIVSLMQPVREGTKKTFNKMLAEINK